MQIRQLIPDLETKLREKFQAEELKLIATDASQPKSLEQKETVISIDQLFIVSAQFSDKSPRERERMLGEFVYSLLPDDTKLQIVTLKLKTPEEYREYLVAQPKRERYIQSVLAQLHQEISYHPGVTFETAADELVTALEVQKCLILKNPDDSYSDGIMLMRPSNDLTERESLESEACPWEHPFTVTVIGRFPCYDITEYEEKESSGYKPFHFRFKFEDGHGISCTDAPDELFKRIKDAKYKDLAQVRKMFETFQYVPLVNLDCHKLECLSPELQKMLSANKFYAGGKTFSVIPQPLSDLTERKVNAVEEEKGTVKAKHVSASDIFWVDDPDIRRSVFIQQSLYRDVCLAADRKKHREGIRSKNKIPKEPTSIPPYPEKRVFPPLTTQSTLDPTQQSSMIGMVQINSNYWFSTWTNLRFFVALTGQDYVTVRDKIWGEECISVFLFNQYMRGPDNQVVDLNECRLPEPDGARDLDKVATERSRILLECTQQFAPSSDAPVSTPSQSRVKFSITKNCFAPMPMAVSFEPIRPRNSYRHASTPEQRLAEKERRAAALEQQKAEFEKRAKEVEEKNALEAAKSPEQKAQEAAIKAEKEKQEAQEQAERKAVSHSEALEKRIKELFRWLPRSVVATRVNECIVMMNNVAKEQFPLFLAASEDSLPLPLVLQKIVFQYAFPIAYCESKQDADEESKAVAVQSSNTSTIVSALRIASSGATASVTSAPVSASAVIPASTTTSTSVYASGTSSALFAAETSASVSAELPSEVTNAAPGFRRSSMEEVD